MKELPCRYITINYSIRSLGVTVFFFFFQFSWHVILEPIVLGVICVKTSSTEPSKVDIPDRGICSFLVVKEGSRVP